VILGGGVLRERARDRVLSDLLNGRLPEGRVNESFLAGELRVSRTPLREALLALQREGLLEMAGQRGFVVPPLTAREVRELYPLIWTLESLGLQSSDAALRRELKRLTVLNRRFERCTSKPLKAVALDAKWHELLLSHCPNRRLKRLLRDLKAAAQRYEIAFMRDPELIEISVRQHGEVIKHLDDGSFFEATSALVRNWQTGMEATLEKIVWEP